MAASGVALKKNDKAPFDGYLFSERTTKEIAEGWQTSKDQYEILDRAYNNLRRESLESIHELQAEIQRMNVELLEDAKKARRTRRHRTFWTVATSVIVGAAIGAVFHNNR